MVCPNCKNELTLPPRAYLNLVGYQEGGAILVASKCCEAGYLVKKEVNYEIKPYLGNEKEDDWGLDLAIAKI